MSINLIVYDLDGTLIDSAQTVLSIINKMRADLGKDSIDRATLVPWISLGGLQLIGRALDFDINLDISIAEKSLIEFRRQYLEYNPLESELYPQVRDTLDVLLDSNKSLALCTNKPRNLVDKILSDLSLDHYFGCVVAGGDLPTQKPHPDHLLKCLDYFDCPADKAILVGDSTVDQKIAKSCGMPFAFFRQGYDDGVNQAQTVLILDRHSDLLGLDRLSSPV